MAAGYTPKTFTLPSGAQVNLGNEQINCPEDYFQPDLIGNAIERVGITRHFPAELIFAEEDKDYSATLKAVRIRCRPGKS